MLHCFVAIATYRTLRLPIYSPTNLGFASVQDSVWLIHTIIHRARLASGMKQSHVPLVLLYRTLTRPCNDTPHTTFLCSYMDKYTRLQFFGRTQRLKTMYHHKQIPKFNHVQDQLSSYDTKSLQKYPAYMHMTFETYLVTIPAQTLTWASVSRLSPFCCTQITLAMQKGIRQTYACVVSVTCGSVNVCPAWCWIMVGSQARWLERDNIPIP